MESKLMPCKVCGGNVITTWTIDSRTARKHRCECVKCGYTTQDQRTKEAAEIKWNAMQEVNANDHK